MKRKDILELLLFAVLMSHVAIQSLASYTYVIRVDEIPAFSFSEHGNYIDEESWCSSGIMMVWKEGTDIKYVSFSMSESSVLVKAVGKMSKEEIEDVMEKAKQLKKEEFMTLLVNRNLNTLASLGENK